MKKLKGIAIVFATLLYCSGCSCTYSGSSNLVEKNSTKANNTNNQPGGVSSSSREIGNFNRINWQPWGEETYKKAQKENKPIFLWVNDSDELSRKMEQESFEDRGIADIVNENFIPVKLTQKEKPEISAVYMKAVLKMTGEESYPMTVFLTPDLKPFFAGSYFPVETANGNLPAFKKVLRRLASKWQKEPENMVKLAEKMVETIPLDIDKIKHTQ